MYHYVIAVLLLLPGLPGGGEGKAPGVHDFHVSYGRMAVEGKVAVSRIRFFKDDLEAALRRFHGEPEFRLEANPRADSLFLAYLSERFVLQQEGVPLRGRISSSGEEENGRETMWWYVTQYESEQEIRSLRVEYTLLFDLFDDQKNIFKVMHYPSEEVQSFYYAEGTEAFDIEF